MDGLRGPLLLTPVLPPSTASGKAEPPSSSPAAQEDDKNNESVEDITDNSTTNNAATATKRRLDYPPATPLTSHVWNKKEEEETSVAARASLNLVSVGEAAAARGCRLTRGYDRSFDDIELNSLQTSPACMAKLTCPVTPVTRTASTVHDRDDAEEETTPRARRRLFKSTAV